MTDELEAFCRDRYPRLVGLLSLYCADGDLAEELAQDALTRLVRDWSKVRRMDSPEAWIHRVALNLANSTFRRRGAEARAKQRLEAQPSAADQPPGASDLVVREALGSIPRRPRTALVLRYYGGFSVRETADIMGCPEGTVKTLTYKAIAQLRGLPQLEGLREVGDAN